MSVNPTIVLMHGAFAESASWNGVIADLHRRGYKAIAVANPLRGLQQDAAYLRSVLDGLSGPVVLAGHSYGGSVMSEAATGATGVTALVYVASFQLEAGESTSELVAKFPGAVPETVFTDKSAAIAALPPGAHTIAIAFVNDFGSGCDRNLHVDKVTLTG